MQSTRLRFSTTKMTLPAHRLDGVCSSAARCKFSCSLMPCALSIVLARCLPPPPPLYINQVIYFIRQYQQSLVCCLLHIRAISVLHGSSGMSFFISFGLPDTRDQRSSLTILIRVEKKKRVWFGHDLLLLKRSCCPN